MVVFANLTETWKRSEVWAPPSTEHLNYIESATPFEEAETLNPQSFQRKQISDDRSAIISGLDRRASIAPSFQPHGNNPSTLKPCHTLHHSRGRAV